MLAALSDVDEDDEGKMTKTTGQQFRRGFKRLAMHRLQASK
jgi:hypothetical protein